MHKKSCQRSIILGKRSLLSILSSSLVKHETLWWSLKKKKGKKALLTSVVRGRGSEGVLMSKWDTPEGGLRPGQSGSLT